MKNIKDFILEGIVKETPEMKNDAKEIAKLCGFKIVKLLQVVDMAEETGEDPEMFEDFGNVQAQYITNIKCPNGDTEAVILCVTEKHYWILYFDSMAIECKNGQLTFNDEYMDSAEYNEITPEVCSCYNKQNLERLFAEEFDEEF